MGYSLRGRDGPVARTAQEKPQVSGVTPLTSTLRTGVAWRQGL
jgi:hypothetical protein